MRKMLLLLLGVLLACTQLYAQTRTVSGKITDDKGVPIPNASVIVKGTSSGTTTDTDGAFSLTVSDKARTLVISAVGSARQEISIGSNTTFSVSLQPEDKSLQEVVVVGYGRTTKQAYTGSAAVVKADQLNNKSANNLSQALAGEVAGVRVINTSGQPGTEATIRIRGFGSVNGNRNPLYVVDGVPFTGNVSSLNMGDVESATILKDATATAIYGARGANGVIVITTKSGRGKSFIEVEGKIGTNRSVIPRYDVIRSPEDYVGLNWEGLYNQGVIANNANPVAYANARIFSTAGIDPTYNIWNVTGPNLIDPNTRKVKAGTTRKYDPENWEDYAFQSAIRSEANVRMGGGDSKTSYFTSFGYLDDVGYSVNSNFKRLTGRINLNHEVKKWLTTSMNLTYANVKRNQNGQEANSNSIFWFIDNNPSLYPLFLRDANGAFVPDPIYGGNQYDYGEQGAIGRGFASLTNAVADANYNTDRNDRHELSGNMAITAKILPELSFETRLGIQYYNDKNVQLTNKFYGSAAGQNGSLYNDIYDLFNYNWLKMLRYSKTFGDHTIEALAAHENTDYRRTRTQIFKTNLVSNDIEDFNNAVVSTPSESYTNKNKLQSFFGQLNYDFARTYYLSASFRRDGTSRFINNKWSNFASVGAGWVISNEGFMQQQKLFPYLKVKASYGLTGEQDGVGSFPGYDRFNINNLNDDRAFAFDVVGNPNLTWETSRMFQAGVEFKVKNFLTGSVEFYSKNTHDLLFDRRVGPSRGFALQKVNGGVLKNQGLEFDLTGHILRKKDYYIDLNINGETFTNKLTKMPLDLTTGKEKVLDIQGNYGWGNDHSIYDFYLRQFAGVDPADGRSQWIAFYDDANNNNAGDPGEYIVSLTQYLADNPGKAGSIKQTTSKTYAVDPFLRTTGGTQFYVGKSAIPKVRGAVNLRAGYKGIDLAVQMLYSFGGYSYDGAYASLMHNGLAGSNNWHTDIFKRWQKAGDITDVPRISNSRDANVASASTRWLTKADYLALNNVRVSYTLPSSLTTKLFVSEATFWVSGDNLWFKSKRDGFNPAAAESGASGIYQYGALTNISAGLRVKF